MAKKKVLKKMRRNFDLNPKKEVYRGNDTVRKITYAEFVSGLKKSADNDDDEVWLAFLDDNSEVFKKFYEYAGDRYTGGSSFIKGYITPLTDFIWDVLADTGKDDDINISQIEELISWYVEDYYGRGAGEFNDSEIERIIESDAYQNIKDEVPQIAPYPEPQDINDLYKDINDIDGIDAEITDVNNLKYYDSEYEGKTLTIADVDDIYDFYWFLRQIDPNVTQDDAIALWGDYLQSLKDPTTTTEAPQDIYEREDLTPSDIAELLANGQTKVDNVDRPKLTPSEIADLLANKDKEDLRQLEERFEGTQYKLYDDPDSLNGEYVYYFQNDDGKYTAWYTPNGTGDKWTKISDDYLPYGFNKEITGENYSSIRGLPSEVYDKFSEEYPQDVVEGTGLDSATTEALPVKRIPATYRELPSYYKDEQFDKNYMYYTEVDGETKYYYWYPNLNEWALLPGTDYANYGAKELNESNYLSYPTLPDEIYNQFAPTQDVVEGTGLDSADKEALPIKRTPATYRELPSYYKDEQFDKNYMYYTEVDGETKYYYWYPNLNQWALLPGTDYANYGAKELNGDNYADYPTLPDEIYNQFAPDETATNDYTSQDYIDFRDSSISKYLGKNQLTLEGDNGEEFAQNLYDLYTDSGLSEKQFLTNFRNVSMDISQYAYSQGGYEFPDQNTLDNAVIDYMKTYGSTSSNADTSKLNVGEQGVTVTPVQGDTILPGPKEGVVYATLDPSTGKYLILQMDDTGAVNVLDTDMTKTDMESKYPGSTQITYDDWDKMTTLQTDTTTDTGRNLFEMDSGKTYAVQNSKGSYDVVRKNEDGSIETVQSNVAESKLDSLANYGGVIPADDYEELLNPSNVDVGEDNTQVAVLTDEQLIEQNLQFQITASNAQINNNINIMQQVDNMGVVDFNYVGEDILYNEVNDNGVEIHTFGGKPFYRTIGGDKITKNEWNEISDSFDTDRDETGLQNAESYFFEMALKYGQGFYNWLDEKNLKETGLSFIQYVDERKEEANFFDIRDGKVKERFGGVNAKYIRGIDNNHIRQKILDTENLGIENPATYILSASTCSMFSIMIMENIKRLADVSIITQFEKDINSGNFKKLDDLVFSGMYPEGSAIRGMIENDEKIDDNIKNILRAIFTQRTYSSLSQFRTANRFSQQILAWFGKNEERSHVLDSNNNGKILFNIGLVCLSYYSAYMGNKATIGIDTDTKSNLLKIISTFLEVVFPATDYDGELIRNIDVLVSLFNNEIRFIPKNTSTNNGTDEMMREVIYKFLTVVMEQTDTNFMVHELFDTNTFSSLISLFNLETFRNTRDIESLTDFLVGAVIDSDSYNVAVKKMMATTLGDKFELDGTILHDVLFMEDTHANIFLNNPKYNLVIPIIHPEVIGVIPTEKIEINMFGFDVPITGIMLKAVTNVYEDVIDEDIRAVYINKEEENVLPTEEDARKRADGLNEAVGETIITDIEQKPDGYGFSEQQLDKFYEKTMPPELKPVDNFINNFKNAEFDSDGKLKYKQDPTKICQILEDEEDYDKAPSFAEIPDKGSEDWVDASLVEFANNNYQNEQFETDFLNKYPNWNSDLLKFDYSEDGREVVAIKNDDKNILLFLFRGSQNRKDWKNNLDAFDFFPADAMKYILDLRREKYSVDINDLYDSEMYLDLKGHRGYEINNIKHFKFLYDAMQNRANKKTDVRFYAHSRGNALGTYALSLFVRNGFTKDQIRYRSFGGVNWLNKEGAEKLNAQISEYDVVNYYNIVDPLRTVNEFSGYYGVGEQQIINSRKGNKNMLQRSLTSISGDGIKTHDAKNYKDLLFQKSKAFVPYRKKKDVTPTSTYIISGMFFLMQVSAFLLSYGIGERNELYDSIRQIFPDIGDGEIKEMLKLNDYFIQMEDLQSEREMEREV